MRSLKIQLGVVELILLLILGVLFVISSYIPSFLIVVCCFLLALSIASIWVQKYIQGSLSQSFKFLLFNSLSWESLLVLIFLFFLLVIPRLNKYRSSTISISGLSDSIKPSQVNELSLSDKVVFKVFSNSGDWLFKDYETSYWRVKTLEKLKNFDWFDTASLPRNEIEELAVQRMVEDSYHLSLQHQPVVRKYDVLLESSLSSRQAVMLDEKSKIISAPDSLRAFWTDQAELWLLKYDLKRIFYEVNSLKNIPWDFEGEKRRDSNFDFRKYIQEHKLYRFESWLQKQFSKDLSMDEVLLKFREFIQVSDFRYSLSLKQSSSNVEAFLLDNREGLCEHYASSLAIILNSLGHTARVVIGYQGGRWNKLGNFLEVQEKDAHAWVEYWDGKSLQWIRVDPTSWVANIQTRKDMISKNLNANNLKAEPWKRDLDSVLQVMGARLNQALDYPFVKDLIQNLFDYSDALRQNQNVYIQFVIFFLSGFTAFLFLRFRSRQDPYLRKFKKVEKKLIAKDWQLRKRDHESYTEWAERCSKCLPDQKLELQKLGRELSYSAYHRIRRGFRFLRT